MTLNKQLVLLNFYSLYFIFTQILATHWRRVLLEKLIFPQLVKELPAY
jgi:hypothetical protein